ncbi:nuclease-related domain-containing protein [Spirillospora sp. NPDC029432]|uniref:nuclease-related domain-containing protein n=1 Tax=Spirillospora sp. NPDC029432 TaxID=3154599 RepID=UPI0034543C2E
MAIMERGDTNGARGQPQETSVGGPQGRPPGRGSFDELLKQPRVRLWLWRAGGAIALALVASILFSVRIGITVAVLAVIADVVRWSRKDSSVPAWQKSSAAERRTEKQLRSLEKGGYHVLHARAVPRDDEGVSDGRIDHLVIGPSGVYAIDSEKWDKRLPVRTLSHRKLFHGPFNKKDRLDEARWEAEQAAKIIGTRVGFDVPVQASVAIYGPSIPWKVMRVRDVDVYAGNRARGYLRRRPKVLTETDIMRIYQAAQKALPPKYPDAAAHLDSAPTETAPAQPAAAEAQSVRASEGDK